MSKKNSEIDKFGGGTSGRSSERKWVFRVFFFKNSDMYGYGR